MPSQVVAELLHDSRIKGYHLRAWLDCHGNGFLGLLAGDAKDGGLIRAG